MGAENKRRLDRSVVAPTREIVKLERRLFMKQGLSLGALTLLSGCDVTDADSVQKVLWRMSRWNDRVQAAIFDVNKLAPTYPESAITQPFPFNAFYSEAEAPRVDAAKYKLELGGLVRDKAPWTLDQLYALPQTSQITRHICVEGWSAIGKWTRCHVQDVSGTRRRRHDARNTSASNAPTITTPASTCRRHCIRKRS